MPVMDADHTAPARHAAPLALPYAPWLIRLLAVAAGLAIGLWLAGTPPGLLGKADAVGYAICHRIAERTFHVHDRPLPLCARCTGIYLGVITGAVMLAGRGRLRAARLPRPPHILLMLLAGGLIAVDGLNSYLSMFQAYTPVYQPHNTLRLITGMYAGLVMITIVLPVFNATVWAAPLDAAPVSHVRDILALWAAAALVIALVLLKLPALLLVAGLVSVGGVLLMFVILGTVAFVTVTGREGAIRSWQGLAVPALAGLTFALVVIGGIDAVRYLLTGTWDGFPLPG